MIKESERNKGHRQMQFIPFLSQLTTGQLETIIEKSFEVSTSLYGNVSREEYEAELDEYLLTQLSRGPIRIRKAWAALLGICQVGRSQAHQDEWDEMVKSWVTD